MGNFCSNLGEGEASDGEPKSTVTSEVTKKNDGGVKSTGADGVTKKNDGGTESTVTSLVTKKNEGGVKSTSAAGVKKKNDGGAESTNGVTKKNDGGVKFTGAAGVTKKNEGGSKSTGEAGVTKKNEGGSKSTGEAGVTKKNDVERVIPKCEGGGKIPSAAKEICTLDHGSSVHEVAIAHDNVHAYTAGNDGVRVWDTNAPKAPLAHIDPLVENGESTPTWSMKLFKHSGTLAVGGWRDNIFIVDVNSPSPTVKCSLKQPAMACFAMAFSPDGRILYTGHNSGDVCVWDWNNQALVRTLEGHDYNCKCIALSPDGAKLWSGGEDDTVRLWDLKGGKEVLQKKTDRCVNCIACSPNEAWVVAGLDNSSLQIFTDSGEDKHKLELDALRINSVNFANSGKWFATTTEGGMLKGFTSPAGPSIFTVKGKEDSTSSCDISCDDSRMVTGLWGTFGTMARVYQLE